MSFSLPVQEGTGGENGCLAKGNPATSKRRGRDRSGGWGGLSLNQYVFTGAHLSDWEGLLASSCAFSLSERGPTNAHNILRVTVTSTNGFFFLDHFLFLFSCLCSQYGAPWALPQAFFPSHASIMFLVSITTPSSALVPSTGQQ